MKTRLIGAVAVALALLSPAPGLTDDNIKYSQCLNTFKEKDGIQTTLEPRTTHRILVIRHDDIEMLRHNFKKKLAKKPKVRGGFRSFVGTVEWNKLKETEAV